MKEAKKYILNTSKYLFLFIIFFSFFLFFSSGDADIIWNYGFSHAIRIGEVPYRDFNIILTPLYPFIMSIGLLIKDSLYVFFIEQAILLLVLIFILDKLLDKKIYFLILLMLCSYVIYPNYNYFCMLLIVFLLYLEKNNKTDYLIGFVFSLLFLTKQSIGIFLFIMALISTFDLLKIKKRIIGFIPMNIIFLLYLIFTNSFKSFIDLCFLGMFDFSSNTLINFIPALFTLPIFIYLIVRIKNNYKDITIYYLIGSFSFIIPICDSNHVCYLYFIFILVLLINHNVQYSILFKVLFYFIVIGILYFNTFVINKDRLNNYKFYNYNHFEYYFESSASNKYRTIVSEDYKRRDNNYMFSCDSMIFNIITDKNIDYFSNNNYGNFGYNGINKMKKKIDDMHDVYFYLNGCTNKQSAIEINEYIIENCQFKYEIMGNKVYYKE